MAHLGAQPGRRVEKVRHHRHETQVFGPDEAKRFLTTIEGTKHAVLFKLALFTGMRPGGYLDLR